MQVETLDDANSAVSIINDAVEAGELKFSHDYENLVYSLREAADAYYNGDGQHLIVDDWTYDQAARLVADFEERYPHHKIDASPTDKVAAGVGAAGDVTHDVPMLSLDNVFDENELREWLAALGATRYTREPKMDGLALCVRYVNGVLSVLATRGDGRTGENVTHNARLIQGLPERLNRPVTIEIRGEVVMTDDDFEKANIARTGAGKPAFVNPRNAAAGTLRRQESTYDAPLSFFAYGVVGFDDMAHSEAMEMVAELGVQTTGTSAAGMAICHTADEVVAAVAELGELRPKLGFAIDGAVIKADLPEERKAAGFTSRAPRWGKAYKYPPDTAFSKLIDVEWQVGRTGVITPRAVIEPVYVGGTVITYATLHNPDDVARKGFMIGDQVSVVRAGEVIPRLEAPLVNQRTGEEKPIVPPAECPRCDGEIDRSQARWRCARGRDCAVVEVIRYATSRDQLDIDGCGIKVVAQLVDKGLVADIGDLFTLTLDQLSSLERMAKPSATKLLAQIEKAKSQPVARILTALAVRGTGRSLSRRIAGHFHTMDAIMAATVEDFVEVDGIGTEKAPSIVAELEKLRPVVEKLRAAGVNFGTMPEPTVATSDGATPTLPLAKPDGSKMVVVVTGAMTGKLAGLRRNEMNELVDRAGGKDSGSVSKATDLLVAPDDATSSKTEKAKALGVKRITPDEFAEMVAAYL